MNAPSRLPAGAELISRGGFNLYAGPFYRLLTASDGSGARFAFIAEEKHMNGAGTLHGGVLMTFADVAMSRTARLAAEGRSCSTVSFSVDFIGPGRLGEVVEATVRVTRRTRTLVFQSADIVAEGRVLMTATGLWKIG